MANLEPSVYLKATMKCDRPLDRITPLPEATQGNMPRLYTAIVPL